MFYCQISLVWEITTSTTLTFIFPSMKKNYIIPANNLQVLLLESVEYLLLKQMSSAPFLICEAPRQPPAFAASCCSPPGPPKRASPALFSPLLRGEGRGSNGGKQIIYKHVPKKKKKKKSSHTQMPPQAETHTIFDPMEEAFSGRSCQDQPGNTDITFTHPLFCLIGFLYRFLV